jgi:photosystem II stability/assembly factor-like uncharacterized protein
MYVGVEEGGVFRSRDGGVAFEVLNEGLYWDVHTVAVDPRDSRRLYATTGDGFYRSTNGGKSWEHVMQGMNRTYTIPLLVHRADNETIFTAAAAGPPPTWATRPTGADVVMYRSDDRGDSFAPLPLEHGFGRGMVMRLKDDPERGGFFAVSNHGQVMRASADCSSFETVSDKLPPAFDLAAIP